LGLYGGYTVRLDPARWSRRSQGLAFSVVIALYLAAVASSFLGFGREPLIAGWLAAAFGTFGALYWRTLRIAWSDIASWTVPLTLWMAVVVAVLPPRPWGFLGWIAGSVWFSLFVAGTPFIPWWYRSVLHKPFPSEFLERPDDFPPNTG
jgi:hypothetical protein